MRRSVREKLLRNMFIKEIMILSLFLLALMSLPADASNVNVINTGDDFSLFLDASHQTPEQTWQAWDRFESKYQDIFDDFIFLKSDPMWDGKRIQRLDNFFGQLDSLEEGMNFLFKNAEEISERQAAKFEKRFPDLKKNTPVIFIPTALAFNGMGGFVRSLQKNAVLIGVDLVTLRQDNIDVLFALEFFQIYHLDKIEDEKIWNTMASPLWFEGFATHVSGILNPNKTSAELFMDEELAKKCANSVYAKSWAKDYLTFIDTPSRNNPESDSLYQEWFYTSGIYQPTRRGSCLGFLVIRDLTKRYSIDEMLLWSEDKFAPEVKAILKRISE